jgi:integrase
MGGPDDAHRPTRRTRARGEGSLWQDARTKRWWYAVSIDGRQRKYRAPDKQTAAARLKQLQEELSRGVLPGRSVLFGTHVQDWMDTIVVNLKPKTQRFYRQIVEYFLLPYLGERTPLKRIGAMQIEDMLNRMRRAGYNEQTVKHAHTVGKTIMGYARKWKRIVSNPFDDVNKPKVRSEAPVPLQADEFAALQHAVMRHRLHALYELSWTLGLRKGELLGIPINALDLQAGTITVRQQVLDLDHGPTIQLSTKNNLVRVLPLTPRLVEVLRVRLQLLLAERGEGWQEHGLLFPTRNGTPLSEQNLDRHFKRACVAAGVRVRDTGKKNKKGQPILTSDLHFHLLRHTCLSWLGDTGASGHIIKAIAGHANSDVTDRYVHVSVEAMRAAVLAMERAKIARHDAPAAEEGVAQVG